MFEVCFVETEPLEFEGLCTRTATTCVEASIMAGLGIQFFYGLPQELCDNIFDLIVVDWQFANFLQCQLVNRK